MSWSPTALDLAELTQWLCGEFDNASQALDQPAWFVHLRLWHRQLPQGMAGHPAIFAEQANVLKLDQPYRQRILVLQPDQTDTVIHGQYWAFHQPGQWRGAGAHPDRLAAITPADVEPLSGCRLTLSRQGDRVEAVPLPGDRCCFQYQGETRQVEIGFTVTAQDFWSRDRGVDPVTGAGLWGALMGAYHFHKRSP